MNERKWFVRRKSMKVSKGFGDWYIVKMRGKDGKEEKWVMRKVDKFYDEEK
jgi:hypothetical protein|tara:strand:+ start:428 stop:580 length:153 start_codon:yes stop_codon:yes gene_type:complete